MKEKYQEHYKIIGANLRRIRTDKGLSQEDLANKCNVERSKISRIENASEDFMFSTLLRIADALEVNVKILLESSNEAK